MTVVTLIDRLKSVPSRFVIEDFGGVFVLSIGCWIFFWCKGFRHRAELISFFFSRIIYNIARFWYGILISVDPLQNVVV